LSPIKSVSAISRPLADVVKVSDHAAGDGKRIVVIGSISHMNGSGQATARRTPAMRA
jgi:hypothetical protein